MAKSPTKPPKCKKGGTGPQKDFVCRSRAKMRGQTVTWFHLSGVMRLVERVLSFHHFADVCKGP